MIHFYGLGYDETLSLPLKTFWLLHRSVDRIRAEEDCRSAAIQIYTQSSEGVSKLMDSLEKQVGTVFEFDGDQLILQRAREERDLEGLKAIAGLNKGV